MASRLGAVVADMRRLGWLGRLRAVRGTAIIRPVIVPSIDLMNGYAVQIEGRSQRVVDRADPLALAEELSLYGDLHVIDLDRAFGRGNNEEIIRKIVSRFPAQVGGGLREPQVAEDLVRAGARRVVVGSAAFTADGVDKPFLREMARLVRRDRIVIALDTRDDAHRKGLDPEQAVEKLERYAGGFLYTAVDPQGIHKGHDLEAIRRLRMRTRLPICLAGGLSSSSDVRTVLDAGASAILGPPVDKGPLNLVDAFAGSLDWGRGAGLLPTLVRDEPGRTLMMAYSNAESLKAALRERRGIFYARSRGILWRKGERSGHVQRLRRVRFDCDRDSLLFVVDQEGVSCHLGYYSCFQDVRPDTLERLEWTIEARKKRPRRGSYTSSLLQDPQRVREKLVTEVRSLVSASTANQVAAESADLLYYLLVLLVSNDINLARVLAELRGREREDKKTGEEAAVPKPADQAAVQEEPALASSAGRPVPSSMADDEALEQAEPRTSVEELAEALSDDTVRDPASAAGDTAGSLPAAPPVEATEDTGAEDGPTVGP